jgi:hypothetical protein
MPPHLNQVVLVHNIGHHDIYFDLYDPASPSQEEALIGWCKPKGRTVQAVGQLLLDALSSGALSATPDDHGGYTLSAPLPLPVHSPEEPQRGAQMQWQWGEVTDERRTVSALRERLSRPVEVRRLYLPLLHAVLCQHESKTSKCMPSEYTLTLLLVTAGARGGRDAQGRAVTPDPASPELIARCIGLLVRARWAQEPLHQGYVARCCHANTDSRKLDASALQVLESPLREVASALANVHGEEWKKHLHVSLSASTGTPAMLSALTLTLSEWKPKLYTISKALQPLQSTPDAPTREYNPIESSMEAVSDWVGVEDALLDEHSRLAVEELRRWRAEYLAQKPTRPKELLKPRPEECFFHRKGLKEVLCVVVVRGRSEAGPGALVAVRGINLEVSLPTGTLCAERNAIGTALCMFPNLQRRDIYAVAVLSLDPSLPNLGPCGACQEWLKKVIEVNPNLRIIGFSDTAATQIAVRPALMV